MAAFTLMLYLLISLLRFMKKIMMSSKVFKNFKLSIVDISNCNNKFLLYCSEFAVTCLLTSELSISISK